MKTRLRSLNIIHELGGMGVQDRVQQWS